MPSDTQPLTSSSPATLLQSAQNLATTAVQDPQALVQQAQTLATTAVQDPQALVQQAQTLGSAVMQNPTALSALVFAGVAVLLQLFGVSLALFVSLGSAVCALTAVSQQQQQQQSVYQGVQQQQQVAIEQQQKRESDSAPSVATGFQLDSGILITLLRADIVSGDISGNCQYLA